MPKSTTAERTILYPRVSVAVCGAPEKTGVDPDLAAQVTATPGPANGLLTYNPPMSHLDARTLMGWAVEEQGGEKFGDEFLLLDHYGRKVRATNNVRNRPYYDATAEDRAQDILNRRFEFNGEPMLVAQEGWLLDGQHTCGGLIRAYERWLLDKDAKTGERIWLEQWPEDKYPDGPTIDKIIIYGISSADNVVNTMNTGKPRSLADVLYRSPYFASLPARDSKTGIDRVTAGKVTSSAIGQVWLRTGMYLSNFGSRRTTAEAVAWLEAHGGTKGKFLACVRHVLEADKDGRVSSLIPLGYAVCVMWLMAQSDTSEEKAEKYYADDERNIKRLDFSLWDKAVEFVSEFGKVKTIKDSDETEPVGKLSELTLALIAINNTSTENSNSAVERNYVITRAWNKFKSNKKVTADDVKVKYLRADKYGVRRLDDSPELGGRLLGGIDLGADKIVRSDDDTRFAAPVMDNGTATPPEVSEQITNGTNGTHTEDTSTPSVPPSPLTVAADGVLQLVASVASEQKVTVVLLRTPSGGYAVWGDAQCDLIAPYVTKKRKMHPKGLVQITLRSDESEQLVDLLTDAGIEVALVVENVAATNGDPKYTVEKVCRAAAKVRKS